MEEINVEDKKSANFSKPSFDSIQEISYNKEKYIRISLIIINIISLITGIYILNHSGFYLNPDYKFQNHRALFIFIIVYMLGMISALIISFFIALTAKIIHYLKYRNQNDSNNNIIQNENSENNEQFHNRIADFIINNKKSEFALIPFTLSYFIAVTLGLYFIVLPYSFFLIINLLRNETYSNFIPFFWLYLFLIINLLAGLIMVISLFYMVFAKRSGSVRKLEYPVDNDNVENIREQVRNAIQI
jgi:hypothetical protein